MKRWKLGKPTREMIAGIIADVILVSAALFIAFVLRYLWLVAVEGVGDSPQAVLLGYLDAGLTTICLFTPLAIIIFYLSGFYTYSRFYRGRYKVLVIIQAVTLSYLILGSFLFLLREALPFPRSVLLLAWFLTLLFVMGARLWLTLWAAFAELERRHLQPSSDEDEIQHVLVIGGAGYIGSALVQRLLELGYYVRVLDLLLYGDEAIAPFSDHPGFELIRGDFRHIESVVRATKDMDAIVHLGAIVGDSACSLCEDVTIEINLRATRTIAEVGKGFGVKRFIFASTCSVYGASDELLDEQSAVQPMSLYGRTKLQSERLLLDLADPVFSPTILRFGTVYGLSGRTRFDLVVNILAAKAVQDGEAGIFGGKQWRPLVHVKDVAEAITLALQAPLDSVSGQIFNVGSGEQNYQIADLGLIIKEMVPTARVVTHPKEDDRNYRVCFDRIYNMLSFQAQYTVRDGIQEVIDAYAAGEVTDYREPRYSNSGFLSVNSGAMQALAEDSDRWLWSGVSPGEAKRLADIAIALFGSQSAESIHSLRAGLERAFLGDVDGFVTSVAGSSVIAADKSAPGPWVDHLGMQPEARLERILQVVEKTLA